MLRARPRPTGARSSCSFAHRPWPSPAARRTRGGSTTSSGGSRRRCDPVSRARRCTGATGSSPTASPSSCLSATCRDSAGLPGVREVFAPVDVPGARRPGRGHDPRARAARRPTSRTRAPGSRSGSSTTGSTRRHPFFDPTGYAMPAGLPEGPGGVHDGEGDRRPRLPAARARPGGTPAKPFDPEQSGHATHVAGIAAGQLRTRSPRAARISGIAPRAYIGNYKALTVPTDANVGLDGNAPEIVAAIEAAVADGMDVINLSIGEPEIEPSARRRRARARRRRGGRGRARRRSRERLRGVRAGSSRRPGAPRDAITVGAARRAPSPGIAGLLLLGPDAASRSGSSPTSSRRGRRSSRPSPTGGRRLRDEHGGAPRLGGRRAAAPAASGVDARSR